MSDKTRKYLLYAVGEIFLVVIGILIALQVNNWNEERKERILEKHILQQVKQDLSRGLRDLELNITLVNKAIESSEILLRHMASNEPYDESISELISNTFVWSIWLIDSGGYESMKSEGINIISDEALRNQIINLFEGRIDFHREFEAFMNERAELLILTDGSSYFKSMNKGIGYSDQGFYLGKSEPLDYSKLREDSRFRYHVETTKNMLTLYQQLSNKGNKRRIERLINDIDLNLSRI